MTNKVRRLNKELSYRSYLETFYKPSAEVSYDWDVSKETMQTAKLSVSTFAAAVNGIRPFGTPEEWDKAKEQAKGIWEDPLKIGQLRSNQIYSYTSYKRVPCVEASRTYARYIKARQKAIERKKLKEMKRRSKETITQYGMGVIAYIDSFMGQTKTPN